MVDQAPFLRLRRREVVIPVECLLDLSDAPAAMLGIELIEPLLDPATFLGVQQEFMPYVLASDGERGLDQRLSLEAAAQKRGMPILLPTSRLLADAGVRFDRLSKIDPERWRALAKDAGADVALVGTLFWIEQEFGWRADWRLLGETDQRWQIRGVSFDQAFRNAMEGSARILSGHASRNSRRDQLGMGPVVVLGATRLGFQRRWVPQGAP